MSFEVGLQTAVLEALSALDSNGVFLERPVRASPPYLVLGPMLSTDWSTKGRAGREVRLLVQVHDAGEDWTRTATLQGEASRTIEDLPRAIGGWRLGSVTLVRARTVRDGATAWLGSVEYRIRAMEN